MESKLMGRPPHDPTTESRAQVTRLSSLGVTHQHMSILLGVTPKTLRKHYRKELAASSIDANVKVLETLYAMGPPVEAQRPPSFGLAPAVAWPFHSP